MIMEMLKYLGSRHCFSVIIALITVLVHVHAQSQSGFISIDCGIPENSSYVDKRTGLKYVSDSGFIDTGISNTVSFGYLPNPLEQQFERLRSFPHGEKNCYTLNPAEGKETKYLIRARFLYGNYDGKDTLPTFDLHLGANKWATVKLDNASVIITKEVLHIPSSEYIFVCIVNTGHGTPFISALELRPLKNSSYARVQAAVLFRRLDIGSRSNTSTRYKDDIYDRIWEPFNFPDRTVLTTSLTVDANSRNQYQPPSSVMSTATAPENKSGPSFSFFMRPESPTAEYYVHMHFAELQKLEPNQSREFHIYQNDVLWEDCPIVSLDYLSTTTASSVSPVTGDRIGYELYQTEKSTHPPILNAFEVYIALNLSEPQTDILEVGAIMKIKSRYGVKRNWQGDPCAPRTFMWEGLNCSFTGQDPIKIISLNLSSSGLTGEIASYISDLTMIQFLDLSNNSLSGSVPEFLSNLKFLKVLDLRGNNLTGSVPTSLIERSNAGSLLLSVEGNSNLCSSLSCKTKKKSKYMVPAIASAAVLFVLLLAFLTAWKLIRKSRKSDGNENKPKAMARIGSALEPRNHQFTYTEIVTITNNFERVIGRGGFGTVYHGYLNDSQVAVKVLSKESAQGYKEFQAEVKLLMRVHHRNLTSLIGYCYDDDENMALIYEYMANGNLRKHLSDQSDEYMLSWEDRLQIAMDAAQGLEYLHNGCKPPIVHRDVKPANILLNEKFQAKIADFGLSRAFSVEGNGNVTTNVAGTPGYLDPKCFQLSALNEKSDVYSFGVVLLEMITSRPAILKLNGHEDSHISQWVEHMLEKGEIKGIIDPKLRGNFNTNAAWKAVEIATACVRERLDERPMMDEVVRELKECLALEKAWRTNDRRKKSTNTRVNMDSGPNPSAR